MREHRWVGRIASVALLQVPLRAFKNSLEDIPRQKRSFKMKSRAIKGIKEKKKINVELIQSWNKLRTFRISLDSPCIAGIVHCDSHRERDLRQPSPGAETSPTCMVFGPEGALWVPSD